ncbi:MAG TPA: hypothetical protein VGU71_15780 [Candidatus Dormibacteraeota bacterium]|nr:hypothetical protein [Candidatus Dormibacteraeota bacterium]
MSIVLILLFCVAWLPDRLNVLLPLLWPVEDPVANALNPGFSVAVADVAITNATALDTTADALEPPPGSER